MPILKERNISVSSTPPIDCIKSKTDNEGQESLSISTPRPFGKPLGIFSNKPRDDTRRYQHTADDD